MLFVPVEKSCNFCSGMGMATMVEIMVVEIGDSWVKELKAII
jgi:hypothetical protein